MAPHAVAVAVAICLAVLCFRPAVSTRAIFVPVGDRDQYTDDLASIQDEFYKELAEDFDEPLIRCFCNLEVCLEASGGVPTCTTRLGCFSEIQPLDRNGFPKEVSNSSPAVTTTTGTPIPKVLDDEAAASALVGEDVLRANYGCLELMPTPPVVNKTCNEILNSMEEHSEFPILASPNKPSNEIDDNSIKAYHCCESNMCNDITHVAAAAPAAQAALAAIFQQTMDHTTASPAHKPAVDAAAVTTTTVVIDTDNATASATATATATAAEASEAIAENLIAEHISTESVQLVFPVAQGSVEFVFATKRFVANTSEVADPAESAVPATEGDRIKNAVQTNVTAVTGNDSGSNEATAGSAATTVFPETVSTENATVVAESDSVTPDPAVRVQEIVTEAVLQADVEANHTTTTSAATERTSSDVKDDNPTATKDNAAPLTEGASSDVKDDNPTATKDNAAPLTEGASSDVKDDNPTATKDTAAPLTEGASSDVKDDNPTATKDTAAPLTDGASSDVKDDNSTATKDTSAPLTEGSTLVSTEGSGAVAKEESLSNTTEASLPNATEILEPDTAKEIKSESTEGSALSVVEGSGSVPAEGTMSSTTEGTILATVEGTVLTANEGNTTEGNTTEGTTTTQEQGATTSEGTTTQGQETTTSEGTTTTQGQGTTTSEGTTTTQGQETTTSEGTSTTQGEGTTTTEGTSTTQGEGTTTTEGTSTTQGEGTSTTQGQGTTTAEGTSTTQGEGTTTAEGTSTTQGQGTTATEGTSTTQGQGTTTTEETTTTRGTTTTRETDATLWNTTTDGIAVSDLKFSVESNGLVVKNVTVIAANASMSEASNRTLVVSSIRHDTADNGTKTVTLAAVVIGLNNPAGLFPNESAGPSGLDTVLSNLEHIADVDFNSINVGNSSSATNGSSVDKLKTAVNDTGSGHGSLEVVLDFDPQRDSDFKARQPKTATATTVEAGRDDAQQKTFATVTESSHVIRKRFDKHYPYAIPPTHRKLPPGAEAVTPVMQRDVVLDEQAQAITEEMLKDQERVNKFLKEVTSNVHSRSDRAQAEAEAESQEYHSSTKKDSAIPSWLVYALASAAFIAMLAGGAYVITVIIRTNNSDSTIAVIDNYKGECSNPGVPCACDGWRGRRPPTGHQTEPVDARHSVIPLRPVLPARNKPCKGCKNKNYSDGTNPLDSPSLISSGRSDVRVTNEIVKNEKPKKKKKNSKITRR